MQTPSARSLMIPGRSVDRPNTILISISFMNSQSNASASTMFTNIPVTVREDKKGNGHTYEVWPKKDLLGAPSRMVGKEGDEIIHRGEKVVDPATGNEVYLIRVKRGKRVWYGKMAIEETSGEE